MLIPATGLALSFHYPPADIWWKKLCSTDTIFLTPVPVIGPQTHTTVLRLCGFCLGQPGWAGTRRNIHPLTPIVVIKYPYVPSPSTTIHGILPIQSTCLTVFFHSLSPSFLWSTSWPNSSTDATNNEMVIMLSCWLVGIGMHSFTTQTRRCVAKLTTRAKSWSIRTERWWSCTARRLVRSSTRRPNVRHLPIKVSAA